MARLVKVLAVLILLALIGLFGYSYIGDMSSPNFEITQPVEPNAS